MDSRETCFMRCVDSGEWLQLARQALRLLGVDNMVLAVHDASFPVSPGEDVGRGTPYSSSGTAFLDLARKTGFTGIQFGPQGQTSEINASPYDGTVFSRNFLSTALGALTEDGEWGRLVDGGTLARWADGRPPGSDSKAAHRYAFAAQRACLREAFETFRSHCQGGGRATAPARNLAARLDSFRRDNASWLERDALYEALGHHYGGSAWMFWPSGGPGGLDRRMWDPPPGWGRACAERRGEVFRNHADIVDSFMFAQFLAHDQHRRLRAATEKWGLKLYGDLQIGFSVQDRWGYRALFMKDYAMGAPPSRTNPEGQPWGYPVLDPVQYFGPGGGRGPALDLVAARMNKMLSEFDGVRLDHPHGHVCPWVYRVDDPDPLHAVQNGARLFCSPSLPDHPRLSALAIPGPDQVGSGPSTQRYADGWVTGLTPRQVERYGILFDAMVEAAEKNGRKKSDLLAEVLSTMPRPLGAVLERHGLGRFRVTQKADMADSGDVYRTENAAPPDWVMVGNHDTPPIRLLVEKWMGSPAAVAQAGYLSGKLAPGGARRLEAARRMEASPGLLTQAKFADLFTGPARNVTVFFSDWLGLKDVYNAPGTVNDDNWTLRVPPDYRGFCIRSMAEGAGLNLPASLAMALRSRGEAHAADSGGVVRRIEEFVAPEFLV